MGSPRKSKRRSLHQVFLPLMMLYLWWTHCLAWRCCMRARLLTVLIIFTLLTLAFPAPGHGGHGHGGYGYGGYGWYSAGAFFGGLLLGSALSGGYYYAPRPVYVYPAPPVVYAPSPVYVYPAPRYGYAYPDPGYAAPQGHPRQEDEASKGEWIRVPGQWVKGRWVPEHQTWVPFNP